MSPASTTHFNHDLTNASSVLLKAQPKHKRTSRHIRKFVLKFVLIVTRCGPTFSTRPPVSSVAMLLKDASRKLYQEVDAHVLKVSEHT